MTLASILARSDSFIVATWETDRARSASEAAVCACQMRNCFWSTKPKYGVSINGVAKPSWSGGEISARPLHPRDALVVGVPGECEHTARPQDAGDLRHRHCVVEPVEGLSTHDDVDRTRADRDVLGGGHHVGDVDALGERASISGSGSVASTSCPARCRMLGQLAGPGTEPRTIERPDPVIQLASSGYDGRAQS